MLNFKWTKQFLMLLLSALIPTSFSLADELPKLYPIRVLKSETSGKYLLVLSVSKEWIDRKDEKAGYESTYKTGEVMVLWGTADKMQRFFLTDRVSLRRAGEDAPWVVNLWSADGGGKNDGRDGYIFSIPSEMANNDTPFIRRIEKSYIIWDEILKPVDSSDEVYKTFHTLAESGTLLSTLINGFRGCQEALSKTVNFQPGNKTLH